MYFCHFTVIHSLVHPGLTPHLSLIPFSMSPLPEQSPRFLIESSLKEFLHIAPFVAHFHPRPRSDYLMWGLSEYSLSPCSSLCPVSSVPVTTVIAHCRFHIHFTQITLRPTCCPWWHLSACAMQTHFTATPIKQLHFYLFYAWHLLWKVSLGKKHSAAAKNWPTESILQNVQSGSVVVTRSSLASLFLFASLY